MASSSLITLAVICLAGLAPVTGRRHLHHVSFLSQKTKAGFSPIFAFSAPEGGKDGKNAVVSMVGAPTPTRFEFQRACYQFVYRTLQKNPRIRDGHPEELKEAVMPQCLATEKKDCEDWAEKLVSVVETKEEADRKSKHHHVGSSKTSVEYGSQKKHQDHEEDQHHQVQEKKHQEKKEKSHTKKVRGAAVTETDAEAKKPVGGKVFEPKKTAQKTTGSGSSDLESGEVWSPPKGKHHRAGAALVQKDTTRYDEWCDQIYEKAGGVVDKNVEKPSASDSVPQK